MLLAVDTSTSWTGLALYDGSAVLGDPFVALQWLANEVSSLGLALEAGQFVSTGTCMSPLAVAPGDRVTADFGVLGRVGVHLCD